jgi:hypothetical protein
MRSSVMVIFVLPSGISSGTARFLGSTQPPDQSEETGRLKIKRKNARYLVIRSPRHPPDSGYFECLHRNVQM